MKKGGIFCLILFWLIPAFGQIEMDKLFQKDNPNIILQNEARAFEGKPLVYLEGLSDKPQPKTWQDELKIRRFGSMEITTKDNAPELTLESSFQKPNDNQTEIQPTFGKTKYVPFISHTADWKFVVNLNDSNLINVNENIVFVLTEKSEEIIRDWPVSSDNFYLMQAELDHQAISTQNDGKNAFIRFSDLTPGVHTLRLNYIINLPQNEQASIPLIGDKWPLISDRFSGVLFVNNKETEKPYFLVGKNKQKFPENFTITQEDKGNIFFQMDKILPSHTQIYLTLPTHKTTITTPSASLIIFGVALGIIILYTLLSGLEVRQMSLEKQLKKFHLCSLNPFQNFIYRSGEICLGNILLLILTACISFFTKNILPSSLWQILILTSVVLIVLADYFIFHPTQKQMIQMKLNLHKESK